VTQELDGTQAAWSPDGRRLFTVTGHSDRMFGIAVWDEKGLAGWSVAPNPNFPAWNLDGRTIWFDVLREPPQDSWLYLANAEDLWSEERLKELVQRCRWEPPCMEKELRPPEKRMRGTHPAVSRNGDLAFVRYRKPPSGWTDDLWVLRKGAKEPVMLSADVFLAEWSPDGQLLAVTVNCERKTCLAVLDPRREGGPRRLAELQTEFREPSFSWSPDGKSIAFLRALPQPVRPGPPVPPGRHVPHDPPPPTAVARAWVATGEVVDVLVPKQPGCRYMTIAWSKGGLLTELRCPIPGDRLNANSEVLVYDLR